MSLYSKVQTIPFFQYNLAFLTSLVQVEVNYCFLLLLLLLINWVIWVNLFIEMAMREYVVAYYAVHTHSSANPSSYMLLINALKYFGLDATLFDPGRSSSCTSASLKFWQLRNFTPSPFFWSTVILPPKDNNFHQH